MNVQVLVATMNQPEGDYSLLEKMNIQSDAIICNQCDRNELIDFVWNGHNIKWLSLSEKGVGLNRNNALMRASADICLFADDDMVYIDGYVDIVTDAFKKNPKADVIVFNLIEEPITRYVISKTKRLNRLNYLRYGTARIAIRLSEIKNNGIYFNQCFGGGTEHCHGEDNLFLTACLTNKLGLYSCPCYIAKLTEYRTSTWNMGLNDKYLNDQGVLYYRVSRKLWHFLCMQDAIRHSKEYKVSPYYAYKRMIDGIKSIKK